MRPREQVLALVLVAVLVAVGFYYGVYRPRSEEARRLEAELERLNAERQRLEAVVASRPQVEEQLAQAAARLQELETKLPSARDIPVLLVQLEEAVRRSRARLTLVRPGPLQAPTPAPTPQPGASPPPQRPEQPQYQTFTVELGAEGDYAALVDFLQRLQNFPRLMVLSDLRVTPITEQGRPPGSRLALTVRATTYVLPQGGETSR
jgi:Tfp pilus assembly protein PilO